ncbi:MAG TPA: MFS transporter [Flavisolibacter sp.]
MQGLRENRKQFYLLVLINAFVGSMVGLERSVIPGLGESFQVSSHVALLSFIAAFGISKAIFNLVTGQLSKTFTRKQLLTAGWIAALPVPFLLMYADNWYWIIAANLLLGMNQGLAWSATVIMKIELVGEKQRGLAMGINEFAGYVAVGLAAFLASEIAARYGFRFFPFLPGILFSIAGLLLTVFLVKDTSAHVSYEAGKSRVPLLHHIWKDTTFRHHNLGSVTVNGFINNLNDGVIWGLLPVLLLSKQFTMGQTGVLAAAYPVIWGLGQLFTGRLGDLFCKKQLITAGMIMQAAGLLLLAFAGNFPAGLVAMFLLGVGTAVVYPNFISVVAENTHPLQRAQTLGIFRFWRDTGYVAGALLAGWLADVIGVPAAFIVVAGLTGGAGIMAQVRMCCTLKTFWSNRRCAEVSAM